MCLFILKKGCQYGFSGAPWEDGASSQKTYLRSPCRGDQGRHTGTRTRTRARGLAATSEFYDKGVTTGLASDTIFALSSGPMTKTGVARKKRIPTF